MNSSQKKGNLNRCVTAQRRHNLHPRVPSPRSNAVFLWFQLVSNRRSLMRVHSGPTASPRFRQPNEPACEQPLPTNLISSGNENRVNPPEMGSRESLTGGYLLLSYCEQETYARGSEKKRICLWNHHLRRTRCARDRPVCAGILSDLLLLLTTAVYSVHAGGRSGTWASQLER